MSARDKAIELVTKYAELDFGCNDKIVFSKMHKKQALLAVEEIIRNQEHVVDMLTYKLILGGIKSITMPSNYWQKVQIEIQLL
jgi:hypothetical protein